MTLYRIHPEIRFWRHVDSKSAAPCWLWTGARKPGGYGNFNDGDRTVLPHVFSYELANGPVPEDYDVDHTCFNRLCVFPGHLEAVTREVNIQRAAARQTHCTNGHEFTPENTLYVRGARRCRICRNAASMASYYRRKQ